MKDNAKEYLLAAASVVLVAGLFFWLFTARPEKPDPTFVEPEPDIERNVILVDANAVDPTPKPADPELIRNQKAPDPKEYEFEHKPQPDEIAEPVAPKPVTPKPVTPKPVTPEPVTPEPVTPEPVTPEPVTPEPVTPEPVTPEPVTPEPVTPEPVTPEPVTPEPVTPEPVTPEPVTPEPVTPEPVTPEPVTPEPVTPEPVTPEPVTPEPVTPEPVTPEPVTPEPVTPEPVTPEPVTPEPVTPEPVTPEPVTPEPVTPEPVTPEPVTPEPVTPEPVTPEPVTPEPVTPEPVTPEPVTPEPVTPEPVTPEPVTPEPITPEPVTPEPVTPEPVTPEPVTPEPVTPEPVTPEPVTPEPITPEPVTPEPVTPEPVTPEPVTPEPVTPEPVTPEPVTPELVTPAQPVPASPIEIQDVFPERDLPDLPKDPVGADSELNRSYKVLGDQLTKDQKSAFKVVQKQWISYRDAAKSVANAAASETSEDLIVRVTNNRTRDFMVMSEFLRDKTALEGDEKLAADQSTHIEDELVKLFESVWQKSPAQVQSKLRETQREWLAYRDLEVMFFRQLPEDIATKKLLHYRELIALNRQRTNLLKELHARLPELPEPTRDAPQATTYIPRPNNYINSKPLRISKDSRNHMLHFEVDGRSGYERSYKRPVYPGYSSGVTLGIGYDLKFKTKDEIKRDWEGLVSSKELHAMLQAQGLSGDSARYRTSELKNQISIDWHHAVQVFDKTTIPKWSRLTSKAYGVSRGELHPDCNGALVGNTFNRGSEISKSTKKLEKYYIKEAIRKRNYTVIPSLFREQAKHWPNTSGTNGLQTRRREEATLFQAGLDQMKQAVAWPPAYYSSDDIPERISLPDFKKLAWTDSRTYSDRNEPVGPDHPIWTSGELHPAIVARKNRILGIGREGQHSHKIRAGVLYAASASAHKTEEMGYHLYVTSGNRWLGTSQNHAQDGGIGDSIDFAISTEPEDNGRRLGTGDEEMKATYAILTAAAGAGANGIGWGRDNPAGHHVEVDDAQRGTPDLADVWPYTDSTTEYFRHFEKAYASERIQTEEVYQFYIGYFYTGAP